MIYPTRRAVILAAAGAPPALLAGLIAPGWWAAAGGWTVLVLGLVLADALIGPASGEAAFEVATPESIGAAGDGAAEIALRFTGRFTGRPPSRVDLAVETNDRLAATPERVSFAPADGPARVGLTPVRRGRGEILKIWARWRGPFGLVWKQARQPLARTIAVTPNITAIKAQAMRLFSRDAMSGLKSQIERGDGSDFHALQELNGAMDARAIDWKQSARHGKLLAKEFRAERNHPIVLALDGGRQMSEPIGDAPRLDIALNAALLLAFVCLKRGDRTALFGFDSRPRLYSGLLSGALAFERLRRLSSTLDYCPEETNYTLGLTQLGAVLKRRSLVVVFTEFTDATTAELMIENVTRLVRRHLVLFVVFRDEELESLATHEPVTAEDVTRAVTAASLLRGREVVIERLRRAGAHILEASAGRLGPSLITAYLDLEKLL